MLENTSKKVHVSSSSEKKRPRIILAALSSVLLIITAVLILKWNFSSDGVEIEKADASVSTNYYEGADSLVDINSADVDLLMTLPGIGEVLAQRIVSYREETAPFVSISDLMNVNGIGASKFSEIKDLITVHTEVENEDSGS